MSKTVIFRCDICGKEIASTVTDDVIEPFRFTMKVPYDGVVKGRTVPWGEADLQLCPDCRERATVVSRTESGKYYIKETVAYFCNNECEYGTDEASCAHCPVRLTIDGR